jgi:Fur family transcriptional regulator, peroxide stress response regulator
MQYRITKQRQLILEEMRKLHFHPTAEEFYSLIKRKLPGMGLCTIYRNLEKFQELGLIEKIQGVPIRFEGNPQPHNHIKCVKCGKVEDLPARITLDEKAIKAMGYQLHAYTVEINGICLPCQKNDKTKEE